MSATAERVVDAPGWPAFVIPACAPSRADILRRSQEKDAIAKVAYREEQEGNETVAAILYSLAEHHWDDAIHVADPDNHAMTMCGLPFRNVCSPDGPLPDAGSGCWSCLGKAVPSEPR